ncbi:hypothetical protein HIO71_08450 [Chryseobacterium aquaticum]|uniref:Uncharacterized protein n=1 Tax=Chryseobacterium aquaticum TaxID=452084 RepID=A0A848N669_9FLAO|nr:MULTISPECIES: hypothetical protein [Chryseobacterium]NMR34238.1 hypothetical protein [Chryseobacterium aquaticum]NRQ46311.1 hypothetical protein [Chryseobacterium sp. C-204]
MKKITTIFSVIISTILYSQDVYQNGFTAGYKAGYCYNVLGCIAPVTPIGQLDVKQDYQTGYNNGFVKGQQDQVSNNTSYIPTGGVKGQLRPSIPDMDLNIDPNLSREMWANYYEKRRVKKEQQAKNNETLVRMITEHTIEVMVEMDKLKIRLKEKNISDKEIDNIIYDLHYENQTIYNEYKNEPKKYKQFYKKNLELKERINKMSPLN